MSKLEELMLYIAHQNATDPNFGKTRLFKELFWADALHYATHGVTITGASYKKWPQGPAPSDGMNAFDALLSRGDAKVDLIGTPSGMRQKLVALREPDLSQFGESELAQVQYVTGALRNRTAKEVSDHSHEVGPWKYTRDNEIINLNMIFIDDAREPSASEKASAMEKLSIRGALTVVECS